MIAVAAALSAMACSARELPILNGPKNFLTCNRPEAPGLGTKSPNEQLIVSTGPDQIVFPPNALPAGTEVTLTPIGQWRAGVRVRLPESVTFDSARISINIAGCGNPNNWDIWQMPDSADESEPQKLPTVRQGTTLSATIRGNSFFIIAN